MKNQNLGFKSIFIVILMITQIIEYSHALEALEFCTNSSLESESKTGTIS